MSDIDLPVGWSSACLIDLLLNIEAGKSFKCEERPPIGDETGVVKVSAVTWGEYREAESKTCTEAARINPKLFIRPGDFLFSRANTIDLIGACVIASQVTRRIMLSDKILRLQFIDDRYKPWVLQFLRSQDGRKQIEDLSTGNQESMRNIGQERIGQIQVPIPPEREKARIVEKLEELLSDLDIGVAELKAAQRKLAQYRQSLLKAAVEGALTTDWRAAQGTSSRRRPGPSRSHEDQPQQRDPGLRRDDEGKETGAELLQRILRERRARWEQKQLAKFAEQGKTPPRGWQEKYPEPVAPDLTDLPPLPEGWAWATIEQLADVGTGVTPLRSNRSYFDGGDIPWTTSGALNDEVISAPSEYVTKIAFQECRLELYPKGTLLLAMYGEGKTRGKCSELGFPSTINQAIAALVFEGATSEVSPHVKLVLLNAYEAMRKQSSGGVQPNLNLQLIKAFSVPLPPPQEQAVIVDRLNTSIVAIKGQQASVEIGMRQAAAQRKNILNAAFSGQLVPQDPNDEPASELLARIRAQREANADAPARKRGRKAKGDA